MSGIELENYAPHRMYYDLVVQGVFEDILYPLGGLVQVLQKNQVDPADLDELRDSLRNRFWKDTQDAMDEFERKVKAKNRKPRKPR